MLYKHNIFREIQCTYIVFILQCKKNVQKRLPNFLKIAETSLVPIIFNNAFYHVRRNAIAISYLRSI
jgi:hypothetical protein